METRHEDRAAGCPPKRGRLAFCGCGQSLPQLAYQVRVLRSRCRTTDLTARIEATYEWTPRVYPDKWLLSALDGLNFVLDNEALARRYRASAGLVSTVP